jgi:pSer/pThr/pTyr-binding forkhead associated (FHA) protein
MEALIQIDVLKGPEKGKIFQVPVEGFTIGRSPEPAEITCALMADVSVSRRHAVGRVEGDRVVLEDWPGQPSKAGILVGGRRVETVAVAPGEPVTLGRTTLAFRWPGKRRGLEMKMPPVWRRWLAITAILALTVAGAAAWSSRSGDVAGEKRDGMEKAWSARCGGDLEEALKTLRELPAEEKAGQAALTRECQRYARLFETPRRLEESLRLDEARDAWAKVALEMRADDPLRAWVETGCVARLSRQLAELRP